LTGLDPIGIRRMKASILKRAHEGAAILISSHLLHLVEEISSRILILKDGKKVIDGTMAEVAQAFSATAEADSLEEIFFRATEEKAPPALPPVLPANPR
jgi:ABC-2 type transport system ATP-binding protein